MFGLPAASTNFLLLRLKDLGLAVGFGAAVIASAAISVASTSALGAVFDWLGIDERSLPAIILARGVGLLIVLLVDTIVLALFFRVVSGIRIPFRMLAQGTIIGAVALGVLKALGSVLLGGATTNPLLAGFAVIIGLLIWFNLHLPGDPGERVVDRGERRGCRRRPQGAPQAARRARSRADWYRRPRSDASCRRTA